MHNINLTDVTCLKLALSKVLGIGIIGASSIVKIPQLLKLLNSQSASGISFLSYALETASYLISLVYNVRNQFPFSTYGEVALIAIQNVAISVLVLQYSGKAPAAAAFVAGLVGSGYALYSDNLCPMGTLQYLQAGAGALGVASKLPQIITIWQEGGTGQLSAFAVSAHITRGVSRAHTDVGEQVFNYLLGSLSRIFTTLQEVPDKLILYSFIAGFALNAVIAAQMVYYWNSPKSQQTTQTKLEPKGKKAIGVSSGQTSGVQTTRNKNSPSTRRRG